MALVSSRLFIWNFFISETELLAVLKIINVVGLVLCKFILIEPLIKNIKRGKTFVMHMQETTFYYSRFVLNFTSKPSGYDIELDIADQEARHPERDYRRGPEQGGSWLSLGLVPLELGHPQPRSELEQPQFHRNSRFILHLWWPIYQSLLLRQSKEPRPFFEMFLFHKTFYLFTNSENHLM